MDMNSSKKTYVKPSFEEVSFDGEISVMLASFNGESSSEDKKRSRNKSEDSDSSSSGLDDTVF